MHYTLADLESVSAVTAEFFSNSAKASAFYAEHCDALSGMVGVWAYVRNAALVLEQESKSFGEAGEDYDWLQTVQEFAELLYEYKTDSELKQAAQDVLKKNKF